MCDSFSPSASDVDFVSVLIFCHCAEWAFYFAASAVVAFFQIDVDFEINLYAA